MHPIPCAHCGVNFMRVTLNLNPPHLCNTCSLRESQRNPNKGNTMDTVDILIKCPKEDQARIEELCIAQGIDFSRYFLELHYGSEAAIQTMQENQANYQPEKKPQSEIYIEKEYPGNDEPVKEVKKKGGKK